MKQVKKKNKQNTVQIQFQTSLEISYPRNRGKHASGINQAYNFRFLLLFFFFFFTPCILYTVLYLRHHYLYNFLASLFKKFFIFIYLFSPPFIYPPSFPSFSSSFFFLSFDKTRYKLDLLLLSLLLLLLLVIFIIKYKIPATKFYYTLVPPDG